MGTLGVQKKNAELGATIMEKAVELSNKRRTEAVLEMVSTIMAEKEKTEEWIERCQRLVLYHQRKLDAISTGAFTLDRKTLRFEDDDLNSPFD